MSYIAFAWIASIIYAFTALLAKFISKYQLKNIYQYSFFMVLFSALFSGIIAISNGAQMPTSWTFVILSGAFLSLANILYISILKKLDVTVISPLLNIRTVITVILGFVILGERLSMQNIIIM